MSVTNQPPNLLPSFVRNRAQTFVPNPVRNRVPNLVPTRVPNSVQIFARHFVRNIVRICVPNFVRNYAPNFVRNVVPNFAPNRVPKFALKTFAAARCCYKKILGKPLQNFEQYFGHYLGEARQDFGQHFGHVFGKTRFLIVELTMSEMLSEFLPTFAQFLSQILPAFARLLSQYLFVPQNQRIYSILRKKGPGGPFFDKTDSLVVQRLLCSIAEIVTMQFFLHRAQR